MFLVTSNKAKRLLYLSYIGKVKAQELKSAREELGALLAELPAGFRVLADFERMDSMDADSAAEMGRIMESGDQKGVSLVVRVMPDASKDIGLNILSLFHYRRRPRFVTCKTMQEAMKALSA